MESIQVTVTGTQITVAFDGLLTSGMVGLQALFAFDSSWEGLQKTAVFRAGGHTMDVINITDAAVVPWEILGKQGCTLYVGVYGVNAHGTLVIPTVWADVGIINPGTDPSGDESTDPSMPVWGQLQEQIKGLERAAVPEKVIAEAVEGYLEENPVDIPVQSVNGKTGQVELTAVDVGAIAESELQSAVDTALAQAKASGEFDGANGEDYVLTEDDKTEIAQQAAALVDTALLDAIGTGEVIV